MHKINRLCEALWPYVRITRVLVTFIAPIILMILYLLHKSFRTKQVQDFMHSFRRDRLFVSMSGFNKRLNNINNWGINTTSGIMELAQLNDMFWVRLTQVIATVIGY
jgi:uncharacterized membrane protein